MTSVAYLQPRTFFFPVMLSLSFKTVAFAIMVSLPQAVSAGGFDASSWNNIAVYWGQNSAGGSSTQGRLAEYCAKTPVNIIPLAFLTGTNDHPSVNFGSASDICTRFSSTPSLLSCPEISIDIKKCQAAGKQIILSIGGATYNKSFSNASEASDAADNVWAMFGPVSDKKTLRPFGDAVVDGFDFDFEAAGLQHLVVFGERLRRLMDEAKGDYVLTAAPQCPYPDAGVGSMLARKVAFDYIMVQFYNNYCGVSSFQMGKREQSSFNMDTWDSWAKNGSKNPDVKVLVGIPATESAGHGYIDVDDLADVLDYGSQFDSFGGVMMWDMSQLYQNKGYLDGVASALKNAKYTPPATSSSSSASPTKTTSTSSTHTTMTTSTQPSVTFFSTTKGSHSTTLSADTPADTDIPGSYDSGIWQNGGQSEGNADSEGISQWGQCGKGKGECKSRYTCKCMDEGYCQCQ